jgi:hypothetical protein
LPPVHRLAVPLLLVAGVLAACGGSSGSSTGDGASPIPVLSVSGGENRAPATLGFPGFATKNTTRVGGADPVADAAAVALAVFPSRSAATRPAAVAVANSDWRAATAAAALMAPPVRAPLLLSDGNDLPVATRAALDSLRPRGSAPAGGGQVIAVGVDPALAGRRVTRIFNRRPGVAALAAAVDRFLSAARGTPSPAVVVVSADAPAYGIPAAAWAAKSGDPVLFVTRDGVPAQTRAALLAHGRPRIYVLGPRRVVGPRTLGALRRYGSVTRIAGPDPVTNAVAFARFSDGAFGWGLIDPGHGLVFADLRRPLDGPASAALGSSGAYGPLLLLRSPDRVPRALEGFLLDIQPGYRRDPVRGVYNRGWLIGDPGAISLAAQSRIDELLEIAPVSTSK